jgi:hypothetical protein
MAQVKQMTQLLKWANRASHAKQVFKTQKMRLKIHTAGAILKERRLQCLIVGCDERDVQNRCSRCGAR